MSTRADYRGEPASVSAARHFVGGALAQAPRTVRERATLLVSELASNAVRHARTPFSVTVLASGGRVRVEVEDSGAGHPIRRQPRPTEPTGRGLLIVGEMSDQWGVDEHRQGKTVWFELSLRADE